ncbi:MAG: PhnD/SsuA/transferrin family substrate-binding protein [Xanthomonadales bacterium]|nr:PhnD/SsuA/transferrin family substrate-binding protein [Xanthomonadales bacterium]
MGRTRSRVRWIKRLALWVALAALSGTLAAQADGVLTLGRISDDPRSHFAQLKPLLDYVVPRMADLGIREGRILMARDLRQMAGYLRRGHVDWVTETTGMAMQLQGLAGARPLLLTERNGVRRYQALLLARAVPSAPITLADLTGRSVAFEHVASTSAYLMPAADMLRAGQRLAPLSTIADRPDPGDVGYLFARTPTNIAIWIDKGLVDAGAVSDLDWDNPRAIPPALRERLRVIHRSDPIPRALEVVRGDLPAPVRDRLRRLLLDASGDPQARPALSAFFGTTAFIAIDPDLRAGLTGMQRDFERVRREVE